MQGEPGRRCKTKTSPKLLPLDLRDPEILQMERDRERVKGVSEEQSKVRGIPPRPCALSTAWTDHSQRKLYCPACTDGFARASATDSGLPRQRRLDSSVFLHKIPAQRPLLPSSPLIPPLLWQRDECSCSSPSSSATVLLGFKTPECPI